MGRLNSAKLGGLGTTKLTGDYFRKINLKYMWFTPDIKEDPSEVTNVKPSVSKQSDKTNLPPTSNIKIFV